MFVQLNKCVVACGSVLQRRHSRGHLFMSWARVARGVLYCEWYGVCDFVVLSFVEV